MSARAPRMQWRRGLRCLQALMDDPDTTSHAMDLQHALGALDFERNFRCLQRDPVGQRLLAERPDLLARVEREQLAALPEGSLGRALLAYFERFDFDPRSLVELGRRVRARWEREEGIPPIDTERAWYSDRALLLHDVFHVVSGYDADPLGEAALLGFSLGQLGGRVNRILTLGASVEVVQASGWRWLPYVLRAWRRGRRAVWLHGLPWEELLAEPLDELRARLRVEPPELAHESGVLKGNASEAAAQLAA